MVMRRPWCIDDTPRMTRCGVCGRVHVPDVECAVCAECGEAHLVGGWCAISVDADEAELAAWAERMSNRHGREQVDDGER